MSLKLQTTMTAALMIAIFIFVGCADDGEHFEHDEFELANYDNEGTA